LVELSTYAKDGKIKCCHTLRWHDPLPIYDFYILSIAGFATELTLSVPILAIDAVEVGRIVRWNSLGARGKFFICFLFGIRGNTDRVAIYFDTEKGSFFDR